jgi:hypothetical protein
VRDYIDKNQDLTRDAFVASVRRQLDRIRPAKRQRELNRQLAAFREAVEKVLPIVQTSAAFNDPVPLPNAVKALLRFVIRGTRAADGALIVRHTGPGGAESTVAYNAEGEPLPGLTVPFANSLAASVIGFQEPAGAQRLRPEGARAAGTAAVRGEPVEHPRAPLRVATDTVVGDRAVRQSGPRLHRRGPAAVTSAAEVGTDLLRQAIAERQTHKLLFDAVGAALEATAHLTDASGGPDADPRRR